MYNENCFDDSSLQDFILVALLSVQLNMMVLRDNTEFKLASLRSVEQVSGLKKKKETQPKTSASREDLDVLDEKSRDTLIPAHAYRSVRYWCFNLKSTKNVYLFSAIGMKDGQKITFHGEGDQEPGLEPGDIIIVLDQKDHSVFTR